MGRRRKVTRERARSVILRRINPTDSQLTIGLDLGDRRHTACLAAFSARFPAATIVMETDGHALRVGEPPVRGPRAPRLRRERRKLRAISASHTKSNEEDAQMLARLGRADPKPLSPMRHRGEAT